MDLKTMFLNLTVMWIRWSGYHVISQYGMHFLVPTPDATSLTYDCTQQPGSLVADALDLGRQLAANVQEADSLCTAFAAHYGLLGLDYTEDTYGAVPGYELPASMCPLNSQKWFFIPWDGDNCLHWQEDTVEGIAGNYGSWEHGVANYWGVLLHQRFLKNEANRAELAAKVDELHESINRETVNALARQYDAVVRPYALAMPDIYYLGNTPEERDAIVAGLGDQVELAYQQFYDSLHELMPFFMYAPVTEGETVRFWWEDAYDFDNQPITYRLRVAATPDFAAPVVDVSGLTTTQYLVPAADLPAGTWYFEVTAVTQDGRTAPSMNKIQVNDVYYPGVDRVEVTG